MSPALVRELDREGAAILQLIDDIPRGREHDMTGHLDAKRTIATRFAKLMKRWREAGASTAAPAPVSPVSDLVKIEPQRAPRVLVSGAR